MRTDAHANPTPPCRARHVLVATIALLALFISPAAAQLVTSGSNEERPVTIGESNAPPPAPAADPSAAPAGPAPSPLSPGMLVKN